MKNQPIILMLGVLALGAPLGADVVGTSDRLQHGRPRAVPGQVVVKFKDGVEEAEMARLMSVGGGHEGARSRFTRGLRVVRVSKDVPVEAAVARFAELPGVEYAEPNYLRQLYLQPNDARFALQWNFRLIGAPRTWDIQQGSSSVTVAVLDSGVASEDLAPFTVDFGAFYAGPAVVPVRVGPFRKTPDWGTTRFATGYDAIYNTGHAWDDDGHGTHVASTIAEATNNSSGVTGLAFGVTLLPIKVCISQPWFDEDLVGCPTFAIAEGIDHARTAGAKVINLSLGAPFPTASERVAVERAAAANIVVVAATGNDDGPIGFPAAYPDVIAVGSVNGSRERSFYSNFGAELDLVAPGGDFNDADSDGRPDYIYQQTMDPELAARGIYTSVDFLWGFVGTSQASPHVAAAAALLISQGITDAKAVREALQQTADDLGAPGRDDQFGYGLINPVKALSGLGLNR